MFSILRRNHSASTKFTRGGISYIQQYIDSYTNLKSFIAYERMKAHVKCLDLHEKVFVFITLRFKVACKADNRLGAHVARNTGSRVKPQHDM